ncbi:hypothetical protein DAI22_12g122600 [Oryza sativa Japonica Group]|nr:hypothetical protein DAI22_12g122600 [Oryza sativa Japonica Group]
MQLLDSWMNKFTKIKKCLLATEVTAVCWTIWKASNPACVPNKFPADPVEVIHNICHWISSMASIYLSIIYLSSIYLSIIY